MSPAFVLIALVALPCTFVIGVLVGYGRGRNDAERDLADTLTL